MPVPRTQMFGVDLDPVPFPVPSKLPKLKFHPLRRLRQAVCSIFGHDNLLKFERSRMFLRCATCGYETVGWVVGDKPPMITQPGDGRHVMKLVIGKSGLDL